MSRIKAIVVIIVVGVVIIIREKMSQLYTRISIETLCHG